MRFAQWDIEPVLFIYTETHALEWIHEPDSQIIGKSIPTLSIISNAIKSFLPAPKQNHKEERII